MAWLHLDWRAVVAGSNKQLLGTGRHARRPNALASELAALGALSAAVFCGASGRYPFKMDKGAEEYEDLEEAFALIRGVVETARVVTQKATTTNSSESDAAALAARSDPAFAAFMRRTQGDDKGARHG